MHGTTGRHDLDEPDERTLRESLDDLRDDLLEVSHRIHGRPEIRFEEHFACELLSSTLRDAGFRTRVGMAGLPTAFLAEHRAGPGGPTVAFFCEYDALEGIGHGCGHNLIATAGLGAALLVQRWLERNPDVAGRVVVVGSPAEEGGGGKNYLIEDGCLEGLDVGMMMHPAGENLSAMRTLARAGMNFHFSGRAAHAAVSPERGINALDAAVLTLNAIGLLRQQLPADARVHAIITAGGEATNIIPERASIQAYVRAADTGFLVDELTPRVHDCARGAALATGTTVEIEQTSPPYAALRPNPVLAEVVDRNFARLGRSPEPPRTEVFPGSTDMGNVSQLIPAIHPNIELVPGLGMHSREATARAGGTEGDRAALDGALLLAMTGVQLFRSPALLDQVRASFRPGIRVG